MFGLQLTCNDFEVNGKTCRLRIGRDGAAPLDKNRIEEEDREREGNNWMIALQCHVKETTAKRKRKEKKRQ